MSYGFASNVSGALPKASFIGFTCTPVEKPDAKTRSVFGDCISLCDIQRALSAPGADTASVPIYFESRICKLGLNAAELPKLDAEFGGIIEGEELRSRERLKTKWAAPWPLTWWRNSRSGWRRWTGRRRLSAWAASSPWTFRTRSSRCVPTGPA